MAPPPTMHQPPSWDDYRRWLGDQAVQKTAPEAPAPAIMDWVTDTRNLQAGQWFVPITGENFDGHKFIAAAMAAGAGGFFYDQSREADVPGALVRRGFAVKNSLAAFQLLMAGWRRTLKHLQLLALTGSSGKTTTKEMLSGILHHAGATYATAASFNNEVGVPKSLQQLTPEHLYAALEFGARKPHDIRFLCSLGAPDIVCLLNVGVAHLGVFGSVENLLNTKLEIFRDSPDHAVQVAFADDPRILAAAMATGKRTVTFGTSATADVQLLGSDWLSDTSARSQASRSTAPNGANAAGITQGTAARPSAGEQPALPNTAMTVHLMIQGQAVEIPFAVAHEVLPINAAAAAAMAVAAGIDTQHVVAGMSGFRGVKGRYQVHERGRFTIIDDTYNANPESMRAGLATVTRGFPYQRKILVLGDMLELGPTSAADHRRIGESLVAAARPALLVTVGSEARQIAEGAIFAGLAPAQVQRFASVDDLLATMPVWWDLGDVLYVKASNGIKLAKLIDRVLGVQLATLDASATSPSSSLPNLSRGSRDA